MAQYEQPSTPKLRFKTGAVDWKQSRAGDYFNSRRERGENGLPIYSVTMDRGLVRRDTLDRHMKGDAADESNLRAYPGDIVYNMMRMWQGAAGIAHEECMVSPAYVVLEPKDNADTEFFEYWFETARGLYLLWAYSYGLTSDRLRLYANDFAKIPSRFPEKPEQQKIAAFLSAVDEKIAHLTRKKALLEDFKKGCMQQLFSQKMRFKDDQGNDFPDWEPGTLSDVAEIVGGGTPNSDTKEYWGGDIPWFTPTEVKTKFVESSARTISEAGLKASSAKLLPEGALLLSTRASVGDLSIARVECATNQGFQSLIVTDSQFNEFWYYWLKHDPRELIRRAAGSTFLEIGKSEVSKVPLRIPSLKEQRKIGGFLGAIDNKIEHLKTEIRLAQTFKKGLLQQMFV